MQLKECQRENWSLRRLVPKLATLVLVGSLSLLIAAGCVTSDRLRVILSILGVPLLLIGLIAKFRATNFASPRLPNGTPKQLAWIRMIVCLTAFIFTVIEDLPAISQWPVEFQRDDQFFHLLRALPGYAALLSQPALLATLQWTTAILLVLGAVGFMTRVTVMLGAVGFFLLQAILRQYTYAFHTGLVPIYLLFILPWTPCAAAWSIDRLLNPGRPEPNRQLVGFSVYACYTVLAIVYLLSGLSKMRESGLDWFRGDNVQHKFLLDALNPIFLDYKWKASIWLVQHDAPEFVYSIIGGVGVLTELCYITVLFSRTARIVMPILAVVTHLGILLFQHILFLDLLLLQLMFVNADRLAIFINQRFHLRHVAKTLAVASDDSKDRYPLSLAALAPVAVVISGLLLVWMFRIEYYPVSSWHMYSNREGKTPIFYYKMVATLENGSSIVVPRRDYSPAVMPNSSRAVLEKAFREPWRNGSFDQFLSAYLQRRDRELAFGSRISTIEVQRWHWNYAVDPHDPRLGWMSHEYVYDAAARRNTSSR